MSRPGVRRDRVAGGFPRVSGDEPAPDKLKKPLD